MSAESLAAARMPFDVISGTGKHVWGPDAAFVL